MSVKAQHKWRNRCFLCERITESMVRSAAERTFTDERTIALVVRETRRLIREIYRDHPTALCSRHAKTVISGLFYMVNLKHRLGVTQRHIADGVGVVEVSVRNLYHYMLQFTSYLGSPEEIKQTIYKRRYHRKGK